MRREDGDAYERFERAVELPMLVLALLFIPLLVVPATVDLSRAVETAFEAASWLIWGAFAAEYVTKLYLAPDRWRMVRTHLLDLVIILVPFLRPLRAARLLRLLRAGSAVGRAVTAWRRMFGRKGFKAFLGVVLLVVTGSGLLAWLLERGQPEPQISSPIDGIWWAVVTSTTVGYGDMVPVSDAGRGVAVLLMLVGVALLSVVTAQIAAFFVESEDVDLERIDARLARIERLLEQHSADADDQGTRQSVAVEGDSNG